MVPTADGEIPRVAALTAAQVNGAIRAGSRVESQAVPMATQVRQGTLFVALPGADGLPRWQPYAEAYLALTAGGHERFDRRRTADSQTKFSVFWMQAIQDIAGSGGGLILIDAVTGRERQGGLANGTMTFDRLEIGGGNMNLTPGDLPGVSMARITHQDAKLPSYFHAEDARWILGVFSWSDSTRTAFGIKQKPSTQQTRKAIVTTSRHMEPEPGSKGVPVHEDRKYARIDETCAFFLQEGEDPTAVIHRVQALRAVHAQYGGHTSLPYPLHELSLLKNAITS